MTMVPVLALPAPDTLSASGPLTTIGTTLVVVPSFSGRPGQKCSLFVVSRFAPCPASTSSPSSSVSVTSQSSVGAALPGFVAQRRIVPLILLVVNVAVPSDALVHANVSLLMTPGLCPCGNANDSETVPDIAYLFQKPN